MPSLYWKIPTTEKKVFLTFDDGPIPEVTEWVLDQLKLYNVKATFFCIVDNVRKHPHIYQRIIAEGHRVGNHTFTHPSGWSTGYKQYLADFEKANKLINSSLFRPPYGKITPRQARQITRSHKIIMWTNLSWDFDSTKSIEEVISNALKDLSNGSIIVMHDSVKAEKNLVGSLSKIIQGVRERGFEFDVVQ